MSTRPASPACCPSCRWCARCSSSARSSTSCATPLRCSDGRHVAVASFAERAEFLTARDFEPRTGDELYLLYTGGTTSYPKGVRVALRRLLPQADLRRQPVRRAAQGPRRDRRRGQDMPSIAFLLAAPLMHGAASSALFTFLSGRSVDPRGDFRRRADRPGNIERDQTQIILIVGDAMGPPLVEQMEKLGEVDMSSLFSDRLGWCDLEPARARPDARRQRGPAAA